MVEKHHKYLVTVKWTGRPTHQNFERDHDIMAEGKSPIKGSSDPAHRGDSSRWNPEELLVASLSTCHQLWYLGLCSQAGIVVTEYEDTAEGSMAEDASGAGQFTSVTLHPKVTISAESDVAKATNLHHTAHKMCFITRSVNFPINNVPTVIKGSATTV